MSSKKYARLQNEVPRNSHTKEKKAAQCTCDDSFDSDDSGGKEMRKSLTPMAFWSYVVYLN